MQSSAAASAGIALRKKLFFADDLHHDLEDVTGNKGEVLRLVVKSCRGGARRGALRSRLPRCAALRCASFPRNFQTLTLTTIHSTVKCLLERTILQNEGNSLLIIGPRGCGKTWVRLEVSLMQQLRWNSFQSYRC